MSKAFKQASRAAASLLESARQTRSKELVRQAKILRRMVASLARLDRDLNSQGQQLTASIAGLAKSRQKSRRFIGKRGLRPGGKWGGRPDMVGYYVGITGSPRRRGSGMRAADTGLVGRRVGRGPVRMASAGGDLQSAKALGAAFARLLSAQDQLRQLREDIKVASGRRDRAKRGG